MPDLRVKPLEKPLALGIMCGTFGGRQFGPAQVFINLNQRGLIVTGGGVADFGTDGFVPALARRFETMKARDQFIAGAAPPNDN